MDKYIYTFIICLCFSIVDLHCDWNEAFDAETALLIQRLPVLQEKNYQQIIKKFQVIRKSLISNKWIKKKLKTGIKDKKNFFIDKANSLIIKKRIENSINDIYPWEIAFFFGENSYITPSFPVDIDGTQVIVQKLESLVCGHKKDGSYKQNNTQDVSIATYWKAHLQAYLLGLSDLKSTNIGINSNGIIRFFDNEASLIYYNIPFKNTNSFSTGFICQSFDWTQYNTPIDRKTAKQLQMFIDNLAHIEHNLAIYIQTRNIFFSQEAFLQRLHNVRSFTIRPGICFQDFLAFIFPKLTPGLNHLSTIMSTALKRKVGHGTALLFATTVTPAKYTPRTLEDIAWWVRQYID